MHHPAMLGDDFLHSGEAQTAAGGPGREERFKDPFQNKPVDAMAGIGDRDAHVASRGKIPMTEWPHPGDIMNTGFKPDASASVHGLAGIVAKVEDDLLQLPALADDDCRPGFVMNNKVDTGRQ